MIEDIKVKKIRDLVKENYVFAYVLYYFGVEFYDHTEDTLEQVCLARKIKIEKLINTLESINKNSEEEKIALELYPIELIIKYLQHVHHIFIKEKLPYLAHLVEQLPLIPEYKAVIKDLKLTFPLFVEDFIQHVYEEEDSIFAHVLLLNKIRQSKNILKYVEKVNLLSLEAEAKKHDIGEEDELTEIREITQNYQLKVEHIQWDVLMKALLDFERSLIIHAQIENEIFFPKALKLESKVFQLIQEAALKN